MHLATVARQRVFLSNGYIIIGIQLKHHVIEHISFGEVLRQNLHLATVARQRVFLSNGYIIIGKVYFCNHKVYQVALLVQNDHFTTEKSIGRRGVKLWSILSCMGMCRRLEKGQSFGEVEIKRGLSMLHLVGNRCKLTLKKKKKKVRTNVGICKAEISEMGSGIAWLSSQAESRQVELTKWPKQQENRSIFGRVTDCRSWC